MFRKLSFKANAEQFSAELCKGEYSHNHSGKYTKFRAYKLLNPEAVLPPEVLALKPTVLHWVEISVGAFPHTDPNITCGMNFYHRTGGSKTTFWTQLPNGTMREDGSFTAEDNDCYLFDVTHTHSVAMKYQGKRSMIKLAWDDKTFAELSELIR